MRASTRRLHHSSSGVELSKRPRSTWPCASRRNSAASIAALSSCKRARQSARPSSGRCDSSQPRRISVTASVAARIGRAASLVSGARELEPLGAGPKRAADGQRRRAALRDELVVPGLATQRTGGMTISVESASCSSSASRTTGHDSSATCAIAAGSRCRRRRRRRASCGAAAPRARAALPAARRRDRRTDWR